MTFVTLTFRPMIGPPVPLPVFSCPAAAGFPSPADDHLEGTLDLNDCLIQHPAATFLFRVAGRSMEGAGILHGDMLVADRSLEPRDRDIVVAAVNGELTVKRLRKLKGRVCLVAENPHYPDITLGEGTDCTILAVVTSAIHQFRR